MSELMSTEFHATTICAVQRDGKTAIAAGDGQVTMGNAVIMKGTARKSAASTTARSSAVLPAPSPMRSPYSTTLKKN